MALLAAGVGFLVVGVAVSIAAGYVQQALPSIQILGAAMETIDGFLSGAFASFIYVDHLLSRDRSLAKGVNATCRCNHISPTPQLW
jgi:hypothetical protein